VLKYQVPSKNWKNNLENKVGETIAWEYFISSKKED
jgi:hypothetical protein